MHSITTLLRRESFRKFSSKAAAAATSRHSGSKDRAGSQRIAHCEAVSIQLPILLPEGGKPKLSIARFFWFHVYVVKSCDNTVP